MRLIAAGVVPMKLGVTLDDLFASRGRRLTSTSRDGWSPPAWAGALAKLQGPVVEP